MANAWYQTAGEIKAIYYISNRKQSQLDATLQNLQKLSIPQADKEHVLLQGKEEKGKEER